MIGSSAYDTVVRMVEFFKRELAEQQQQGESGLHVIIAREGGTQIVLHHSGKDVASELGMNGPLADSVFVGAVRDGYIGASWGEAGPNANTAMAWLTHIPQKGLQLMGEWVDPQLQPSQQFTYYGPAYGIFGSQQNFSFEQTVRDLDEQIEEHGGDDKDELREMLAEIRDDLENQDSISRSKFERWSELANKHLPWLLGPLGSLLINYIFGTPGTSGGGSPPSDRIGGP